MINNNNSVVCKHLFYFILSVVAESDSESKSEFPKKKSTTPFKLQQLPAAFKVSMCVSFEAKLVITILNLIN